MREFSSTQGKVLMVVKHNPHLVLIVDDQDAVTRMLARIFESEGYQVRSVHNGEDAVSEARRLIPNIILLDVMMPGMSGFDVLKILHGSPATASIPIIMLTAKDTPADIERGLELGADDYVPKPFHPRELIARVRSKVRARELEETLERRTNELEALLRASEALNRNVEIADLLNVVLYLLLDLLPTQTALIYQLDEAGEIMHFAAGGPQSHLFEEGRFNHKKVIQQFFQAEVAIIWPDDPPLLKEFPCGMAVPLRHGNQTHGLLIVGTDEPLHTNQFLLLEGIGRQATLALRNVELFAIKTQYAEHLEEMVAARTAELQSAQQLLMRSEKLAAMGRLAAGLAHEINNPLMPLHIDLEDMIEDIRRDVAPRAEDLEHMLSSVERITRIVQRFLEFTGKGRSSAPDMELVDVNQVIENVLDLNEKFLSKEKIKIKRSLTELPSVHGNRDQLEQVFLNIVINAQAAMSNGGTLSVTSRVNGTEVLVDIKDTGHGIPEELMESIFEPFVSTKEDGTGLGLFISHNIIQNHHGAIEVKSAVGKGSTFTIRLPIAQAQAES